MSLITEEIRSKATEFYTGEEMCQEKSKFLLTEMNLPNGLLPLKDMLECGYIEGTGFVWLKQKKKSEHKFEKIGKNVQYGPEVTAVVEKYKIKKLTGVKAKELMMWVTINEISIDDPSSGKITFKSPTGLSRTFPISAFELEETKEKKEVDVKDNVINGGGVGTVGSAPAADAAKEVKANVINGVAPEAAKEVETKKVEVKEV